MNFRIFILLFLIPFAGSAKPKAVDQKQFVVLEDSLQKMGQTMFRGSDQEKLNSNKKFTDLLRKVLNMDGAFDYPFDSLKFIANLTSSDKAIRIFNWDIPKNDGTYIYYGFLFVDDSKTGQDKKGQKNKFTLYELDDKSAEIKNPELAVLSTDKWFGALYYKIIVTNDRDKKYYTVLGWDGNTNMTWKKIIDVITFGKDGQPIFGEKSIFDRGKRSSKRVIFEFRADLTMTLRYEDDKKRIVFDHLAPEVSGAEGMYQFYSQTFVYDCFNWKKGKWRLEEDIDARNDKNKKDNEYIKPQGDQNPGSGTPAPSPSGKPPKKKLFHHS
ncbi:MAG TPA: hypothetical protein VFJ43_11930 [Bacteroidia bacterium]|nr:hypothetical protein [Bacteroidia bacterium]